MTNMDIQQYKYRRNFPYNNTIKEESAEMLSENKSSVTFTSALVRGKQEHGNFQNVFNGGQFMKRKSVFSNQLYDGNSPDEEFDMKSENFVRNYSNQQGNQKIYIQNMNRQEISNFNKQSSEKYFKQSETMGNYRSKKVGLNINVYQ
jgi:hypothetical protein